MIAVGTMIESLIFKTECNDIGNWTKET